MPDVTIVERAVLYNQKAKGRGLFGNLCCWLGTPYTMQNIWASNPVKRLPENADLSFSPLIKDQMHRDLYSQSNIQHEEANNSEKFGLPK